MALHRFLAGTVRLASMSLVLCVSCGQAPEARPAFPDLAKEPPVARPAKYTCYRTIDPIRLDGVLSEKSWQAAPSTGCFRVTADGKPGPLPARAKMVWDDRMLYIAFECADPDIYATFTGRDEALYNEDVVEVFISEQTRGKNHYVEYEFSPRGAMFDAYVVAPYRCKLDWNSSGLAMGAKVYGSINEPGKPDRGFVIEVAIPIDGLFADEYKPKIADGRKIRMNLYRIDYSTPAKLGAQGAKPIYLAWSPTESGTYHAPAKFGTVTFSTSPPPGAKAAKAAKP